METNTLKDKFQTYIVSTISTLWIHWLTAFTRQFNFAFRLYEWTKPYLQRYLPAWWPDREVTTDMEEGFEISVAGILAAVRAKWFTRRLRQAAWSSPLFLKMSERIKWFCSFFVGRPQHRPHELYSLSSALDPVFVKPTPSNVDHMLCELSKLAYEEDRVVAEQCQAWNNEIIFHGSVSSSGQDKMAPEIFRDTRCCLFSVPSQNAAVVAFRGAMTTDLIDWLCSDFGAELQNAHTPNVGLVQVGLENSLGLGINLTGSAGSAGTGAAVSPNGSEYSRIVEALNKIQFNTLMVTGHSLGGAQAVIFAGRYVPEAAIAGRKVPCILVTFGQPRVGDQTYAMDVAGKVTEYRRYVMGNDLIARLPVSRRGYSHSGMLIHIDHDDKLHLVAAQTPRLQWMTALTKLARSRTRDENVLRISLRFVSFAASIVTLGYGSLFGDHMLGDYERALRSQKRRIT